jgi:hypothetical protein
MFKRLTFSLTVFYLAISQCGIAQENLEALDNPTIASSQISESELPKNRDNHRDSFSLEARAAYFYPTDHRFREFFSGGGIYGLEFNAKVWQRLFVWGEVDYFSKTSRTKIDFGPTINAPLTCFLGTYKRDRTRVTLVPCSAGLKYYFNKDPVQFYLGAGFLASYLHTDVHSKTLVGGRGKWGFGGAFKSGFLCHIGSSFLLDFFTDYYLVEAHPHRSHHKKVVVHSADISGFSFGGAIGYLF